MFQRTQCLLKLIGLKQVIFNRKIYVCSLLNNIEKCELSLKEDSKFQSVVGLEIHAQINANSKLFSGSGSVFGSPTNTQVSYFDASLPGTLPVLNKYCVESAVQTAIALNCTIHKKSMFDRKHYFYSDLPAGYQMTQQFHPIATDGYLEFQVSDHHNRFKPYLTKVKLKQIQLEQDSGKSFHFDNLKTLIDLNRAGIGLMELVFEPDLKNGSEASCLVKELQLIFTTLGICSCAMEEGAFRVDANISVNEIGQPFGVRTEVKNINSNSYIAKAIDYEIQRQIEIIEAGGLISNETRSYDYKAKKTIYMRDKEKFQDYRFMPEPNLPPIQLCDSKDKDLKNPSHFVNIDEIKSKMPQLPTLAREQLMNNYHLSYEQADRALKHEGLREFFETIETPELNPQFSFSFLTHCIARHLNNKKQTFKNCDITTAQVRNVLIALQNRNISNGIAHDIVALYFEGDKRSVNDIVDTYNWSLIKDEVELEKLCGKVLGERKKFAKRYKNNKRQKDLNMLIEKLNENTNKRVASEDAENMFNKLIHAQNHHVVE